MVTMIRGRNSTTHAAIMEYAIQLVMYLELISLTPSRLLKYSIKYRRCYQLLLHDI